MADCFNLEGTRVAGKFEVGAAVSETHHAVTYRASRVQTGAHHTLKVFKVLGDFTPGERETLLQNLIQSAVAVRVAAARNHGICAAEEMGPIPLREGKWVPYIAYDWLDGLPLSQVVQEEQRGGLPPRSLFEAMQLLDPVMRALATAHGHGVIHGGLSPSSIMVVGAARSANVDVRVIDFGVAQAISDARIGLSPITQQVRSSHPGQMTITPAYYDSHFAAPEQVDFTGHAVSAASDVYSLALVLAHLLVYASDATQGGRDPADYRGTPGRRGVVLKPEAELAFQRALSRRPEDRQPDVASLWNELRGVQGARPSETPSNGSTRPVASVTADLTPASFNRHLAGSADATLRTTAQSSAANRSSSRRPLVMAGVAALMVVVGGAVVLASSSGDGDETESPPDSQAESTKVTAPKTARPAPSAIPTCAEDMAEVKTAMFFMGSDETTALEFEKPAHQVKLSAYCIDLHEVTVAEYKVCSDKGECKRASKVNVWMDIDTKQRAAFDPLCNMNDPVGRADHPVNCVTFRMAQHFCENQGKRLPTEAEWELAARGTDGRIYPWGDEPPTAAHLNACGTECAAWAKKHKQKMSAMYDEDDGYPHTAPVGSFPMGKTTYGLVDVVGNVWEWVGDWYMPYTNEDQTDPQGPERAEKRVIRGGAWNGGHAAWVRPTFRYRDYPDIKSYGIGFRCARSL